MLHFAGLFLFVLQCGEGGVLRNARGAQGDFLVAADEYVQKILARRDIADTEAAHRVALGERLNRDRALPHAGKARNRDMLVSIVQNALIGFIGDNNDVVFDADLAQPLEASSVHHRTGRVTGGREHEKGRSGGDTLF